MCEPGAVGERFSQLEWRFAPGPRAKVNSRSWAESQRSSSSTPARSCSHLIMSAYQSTILTATPRGRTSHARSPCDGPEAAARAKRPAGRAAVRPLGPKATRKLARAIATRPHQPPHPTHTMSTETQDELAFRSWLTARGAVVSPAVGLTQFEGMGRGAVALEDIEVSMRLPSALLEAVIYGTVGLVAGIVRGCAGGGEGVWFGGGTQMLNFWRARRGRPCGPDGACRAVDIRTKPQ